jgi:cell division protein FtsB
LERARTLPDARIVDRLVRGRAWIALIGFLLMGLVAMQVSQLKLSASVSRAVQQGANLERRNGELQAAVSRLSAEQRMQDAGARLGMFIPAAGAIHFLRLAPPRDATQAASALRTDRPVSVSSSAPAATADTPAVSDQTPAAPAPADAPLQPQAQTPSPGGTAAPPPSTPQPSPADSATTGAASAPAGAGPNGQG